MVANAEGQDSFMTLILSVLRSPGTAPPDTTHIHGGEFRIGRGADNDWTLPDPARIVSKHHCLVIFRKGAWAIADTSTNGTYLNGDKKPLGAGQARGLQDGDRIRIGGYEIEARITDEVAASTAEDDWDASISLAPAPVEDDSHAASDNTASPVPPPATESGEQLIAAFLLGAGLPNAQVDDPAMLMLSLGGAFRAMVSGLRQALIARAAAKGEFRIDRTMMRARGNNPLKFSADDDDALATLLGFGRRTDLKPESAIAAALRDMRLHDLATMAAMQGAVRAVMAELAPARLRDQTDFGGMSLLPAQKKARAFDAYEKLHDEVSRALADDFDSVFGKSFARAYELALRDLSAREP